MEKRSYQDWYLSQSLKLPQEIVQQELSSDSSYSLTKRRKRNEQ